MYVYQIENSEGKVQINYATGTRIYTRKQNALNKCHGELKVVEYKLVPTGRNTFKEIKGE
jgi:hypothetical protein